MVLSLLGAIERKYVGTKVPVTHCLLHLNHGKPWNVTMPQRIETEIKVWKTLHRVREKTAPLNKML